MIGNYKVKTAYKPEEISLNVNYGKQSFQRTGGDKVSERTGTEFVRNIIANRLLTAQSESQIASLMTQMQPISFKSGEAVYQPEDNCNFVYFPETAVFSQMNILEDGKTIETAMIGSEGMLGISSVLDFQPTNFWTQTLLGGTAYRINRKVFQPELMRGGLLQSAFLQYVNAYIRQIAQRAVCNNHHRIENRFATWLLLLADRNGQPNLALTQEQIAAVLGVQRPSVTCIAQNLRSDGSIEYMRGRIILNRRKLQIVACECYAAMSQN